MFAGPAYQFTKDVLYQLKGEQSIEQLVTETNGLIDQSINTVQQLADSSNNVQQENGQFSAAGPKQLASAFFTAFSEWQTDFTIAYKGDTSNIEQTIEDAVDVALAQNEYVLGHTGERSIQFQYTKSSATIQVQQSYLTTPQQEGIVNEQVQAIVSKWQGLSNFDKIRAVNDYIVTNTVYTTASSASPHSAYAVLAEGKGVCQGYALLALKMLQELGITTKYVVGYVGAEGHAWNLVQLDGQWYHLDPTWNDPVPDRTRAVSYEYFLVDDATLAQDHTWIQKDYPAATSKRFADMHNADFAVALNGKLYYSHLQDDNQLYVLDLNTLQTAKLSNSRALYVTGHGNWLYFSNYSNGAYIYKMQTDGSGEQLIYQEKAKNLFIENGYLYFETNSLKKMPL